MSLSIQPPYPVVNDTDGQPLENGYIWIGAANLPPITNPISIYWDAALTQPAAQPVRTQGGYPSNAGNPGRLYAAQNYSILVQNSRGVTLYSAPQQTELFGTDSGGTGLTSYAVGDLLYADGSASLAKLAAVVTGNVLRSGGVLTAPAWGKVDLATDTSGDIDLATQVTGTLPVANGGTGAATLAANNVLLGNGTSAVQEVAPGTDGNILTSNGTTWQSVAAPPKTISVAQFVSTTTWAAPAGVTQIKITATGGGGGGGANNTGGDGGSGGYGGACVALVTVAPGTTYEVTIGVGGDGSNTSGVNGNAGAETWFGVNSGTKLISCTGGGGGVAATAGSPGANGSNGTATITGTTLRSGIYSAAEVGGKYGSTGNPSVRDDSVSTAVAWSASSTWFPGVGGRGENSGLANNCSGGVNGFIRIEYVG